MDNRLVFSAFSVLSCMLACDSLKCNEGVNVTLYGLPLYHWRERECFGPSSCFTQEIVLKLDIPVAMRYGGCISKSYSNLFTCKKLFSKDSNFNPSTLLSLITDADDLIESMAEDFRKNQTKYMPLLFSRGKGIEEFVEGLYTLGEKIGLDMTEARKLKQPLTSFLSIASAIPYDRRGYDQHIKDVQAKESELIQAFGNLTTKHLVDSGTILSFLKGFSHDGHVSDNFLRGLKHWPIMENAPGLLKSMLKNHELAEKWFDAIVNALSKANRRNPAQSSVDMFHAINSTVTLSAPNQRIIQTMCGSIFDCIDALGTQHPLFVEKCVTSLLKPTDSEDYAAVLTTKIQTLAFIFTGKRSRYLVDPLLPRVGYWVLDLVRAYSLGPVTEIDRVYHAFIDSMNSVNYTSFNESKQLEKTKMSDFLVRMASLMNPHFTARQETFLINVARSFYNPMTTKDVKVLDTLFSTLTSGFATFPKTNYGQLLKDLMENLEVHTPLAMTPIFEKLQTVVDAVLSQTSQGVLSALLDVAKRYKSLYPESKFPPIVIRYLHFFNTTIISTSRYRYSWSDCGGPVLDRQYYDCMEGKFMKRAYETFKLRKQVNELDADLFFAVLEATGVTSDSYINKSLAQNRTLAVAYARLMKSMSPGDVKELMNDYVMWTMNIFRHDDNYKFDNFILAINYTTNKITTKLSQVMKDIRYVHAPESCRHVNCDTDGCNTRQLINAASPRTKSMMRYGGTDESQEKTTTPSGSDSSARASLGLCIPAILVSFSSIIL